MSDIEIRLLYPNLGEPAGAVVSMEPEEARTWVARRLAVLNEADDAEALHATFHSAQAEAAVEMASPPAQRRRPSSAPPIRPVNRAR